MEKRNAAEATTADESLTDKNRAMIDGALSDLNAAIAGLTKLGGTPENLGADGDGTITGVTGSAKTGAPPIAMAMAAAVLAGAAITIKKRRFESNNHSFTNGLQFPRTAQCHFATQGRSNHVRPAARGSHRHRRRIAAFQRATAHNDPLGEFYGESDLPTKTGGCSKRKRIITKKAA